MTPFSNIVTNTLLFTTTTSVSYLFFVCSSRSQISIDSSGFMTPYSLRIFSKSFSACHLSSSVDSSCPVTVATGASCQRLSEKSFFSLILFLLKQNICNAVFQHYMLYFKTAITTIQDFLFSFVIC